MTSAGSVPTPRTTDRSRSRTSPSSGPAWASGGRVRGRSWHRSATDDLSNAAFPYLTARQIAISGVPVLALRVTYVGELGWELYCPMDDGLALWDALWAAGQAHGMVAGGLSGHRQPPPGEGLPGLVLGHHPRRHAVPGRARLRRAAGQGAGVHRSGGIARRPARRRWTGALCCLVLDEPLAVALGNEPIRVGGEVVGRVTSGGYGFAVGASIAYGYLPVALAEAGTRCEVEVFGEWIGAVGQRRAAVRPGRVEDQVLGVRRRRWRRTARAASRNGGPQPLELGRGELRPLRDGSGRPSASASGSASSNASTRSPSGCSL